MYAVTGKFLGKFPVFFKKEITKENVNDISPCADIEEASLYSALKDAKDLASGLSTYLSIHKEFGDYRDIHVIKVKVTVVENWTEENDYETKCDI